MPRAKFIELTSYEGRSCLLNLDHIVQITTDSGGRGVVIDVQMGTGVERRNYRHNIASVDRLIQEANRGQD